MTPDDSWTRHFNLPQLPDQPHRPRPSLRELLFPRCSTCGETCGDLLT